jgi:predicted nucleic acid-binding protein
VRPNEEKPTRIFMKSLLFLAITEDIAEHAGRLKAQYAKRGRAISFQDASIAAVCIAYGCALVTENTKDFPMPELQLYPLSKM